MYDHDDDYNATIEDAQGDYADNIADGMDPWDAVDQYNDDAQDALDAWSIADDD
jgi:hypothetical protein